MCVGGFSVLCLYLSLSLSLTPSAPHPLITSEHKNINTNTQVGQDNHQNVFNFQQVSLKRESILKGKKWAEVADLQMRDVFTMTDKDDKDVRIYVYVYVYCVCVLCVSASSSHSH